VEVVDLGVELGEMLLATGAPQRLFGAVTLGQCEVVAEVALIDRLAIGGGREAIGGVGADRLEHHQSRWGVRVLAAHEQALGHQAVQRVKARTGDRLDRLYRRAAREHREARETRLLGVREQLMAPVEGRA
jgi:hypothetical protein